MFSTACTEKMRSLKKEAAICNIPRQLHEETLPADVLRAASTQRKLHSLKTRTRPLHTTRDGKLPRPLKENRRLTGSRFTYRKSGVYFPKRRETMNNETPNLKLPFILPSQAQKHVTHNEALLTLDALVHLTLTAKLSTPAIAPEDGAAFAVGESPAAPWSGQQNNVAVWQDGAWHFITPREGWRAWFVSELAFKVFANGEWRSILPAAASFAHLGISASPDETNRLAVASPASLFTHAGGGHQLKINKQQASDSATLLFQSGWAGHAEIGLAGDNSLSFKVSDGNTWRTALSIDAVGRILQPHQPVARVYRAGTSFSPAAGQQSGFTDFAVQQGDFSLGSTLAGGGQGLVIPRSGNFLVCLNTSVASSSGHVTNLLVNGASPLLALPGGTGLQSGTTIAALAAGDVLTLGHSGTAQFNLGPAMTQLSVLLL